ncbi:hypothetical protein [Cellulomonas massiliensis]|uniref:hypothetical protein n=1 Tax=Cellulomonas massiliensis TaxID=1465811 RepID=UPI0002DF429B|nr:hypothetical protein [Cellulomonas massiliensis]
MRFVVLRYGTAPALGGGDDLAAEELAGADAATTVVWVDGRAHVLQGPAARDAGPVTAVRVLDAPHLDAVLGSLDAMPGATYEIRPCALVGGRP